MGDRSKHSSRIPGAMSSCLPASAWHKLLQALLLSCSQFPMAEAWVPARKPVAPTAQMLLVNWDRGNQVTFWAPTSWGSTEGGDWPLHRAEPQSPTPQRRCPGTREAVRRTGQHVFGGPAVGWGHSDRSSHTRLTSLQPPGSCHHSHFSDKKTEPPIKALPWTCVMPPYLPICLAGLEPGLLSHPAAPTLQPTQIAIDVSVLLPLPAPPPPALDTQ